MKLNDYISVLNKIAKKHGDLDVVYAADDEGNTFNKVNFLPDVGHYDGCDFYGSQSKEGKEINSVCLN